MKHTLCPAVVEQSMPIIVSLARSIINERNVPLELDELISAGIVGLGEAASRFDGKSGRNLITFAYWRIRGAMIDAVAAAAPVNRTAWRAGAKHPVSLDSAWARGRRLAARQAPIEDLVDERRRWGKLAGAVESLTEREQELVMMRYVQQRTLADIGRELGVSKSWISRIHSRLLDKLRGLMADDRELAAAKA